jgi:HEPN domain-containing protein
MPLDPILVADTRAWFHKAVVDLRSADADLGVVPPILEDVVFHCQQAAEKSLKGFLTFHQRPFGKTHDLRELSKTCLGVDPSLQPILEDAIPLTRYVWQYRYPGNPEEPEMKETQEAVRIARELVSLLLQRLPGPVRP